MSSLHPAHPLRPPAATDTGGLTALGWDPGWQAVADDLPGAAHRPARVARADRGQCVVRTADRTVQAPFERRLEPEPTTGDWVLLDADDRVTCVLPRRTAFVRGAGRGDTRPQVLAANLDVVFLLVPLSAAPNLGRLERMLALAWQSGARPVVLLSKADLAPTAQAERAEVAAAALGAEVLLVSVVAGTGLDDVRATLPSGATGALLGVSGAGKSSLVNAFVGHELLTTREVDGAGKGRHTSVTRELVPLPWGALLIDTPGLRGMQLWAAEEGLERTFADVEELTARCRFPDCGHDSEPGCAVTEALSDGRLTARRYTSYVKLQREQAWLAGRYDARQRAEQRAVWKRRTREGREARRQR